MGGVAVIQRLLSLDEDRRVLQTGAGELRLCKQLGKGGFAPVWLAREMLFSGATELRTVAIKLFAEDGDDGVAEQSGSGPRSEGSGSQRARVFEEARALCRVDHPNVVRFYSICHDPTHHVIGLVMEYIQGTSLDTRLRDLYERGEVLPLKDTIAVGAATASALAAVHYQGLVHRDVKPANIIESSGVYKLIDFGIAAIKKQRKRRVSERPTLSPVVVDGVPLVSRKRAATRESVELDDEDPFSFSGTTGYMDPHCFRTMAPATPASDLYALGATLYECLAGGPPALVAAKAAGQAGMKIEVLDGRERPPSVRDAAPSAPPALVQLIDALVDPEPEKRPRSAEAVAWELERIRHETMGRSRKLPVEGPFRGLGRFEQEDRDVYFGRSVEIAASLEMLRSRGLLALIGVSGSGKSSLARAGILPAIAEGGLGSWPKKWRTVTVNPGVDPRVALVTALSFLDIPAATTAQALVTALAQWVQANECGVALLVDQLEELVTQSSKRSQDFAVQVLAQLGAHTIPGVRTLVAARSDLVARLVALPDLGRALTRGMWPVSSMSEATWEDVIEQALGAYGYHLEDDARAELTRQLKGKAEAMPLVQFALTELWERRDTSRKVIPRAALEAIGGIAGALERHADATLAGLAKVDPDAKQAARAVLVSMTTTQGTRCAVARTALDQVHRLASDVVPTLEAARLVVQESDDRLTLAHDALTTQWGALRGWIEEARADRVLADTIERAAKDYAPTRDVDLLWKGRRLWAAEDLARRSKLSDGALAFLQAARAAERRGRNLWISMLSLLLMVGLLTVMEGCHRLHERESDEVETLNDLAQGTASQVAQLLMDTRRSLQVLARDTEVRELLASSQWPKNPQGHAGEGPACQESGLQRELVDSVTRSIDVLRTGAHDEQGQSANRILVDDVYLVDKRGTIQCVARQESVLGHDISNRQYFTRASAGQSFVSTVLEGRTDTKSYSVYFAEPVFASNDGKDITGVAVLELKGRAVERLAQHGQDLGQEQAKAHRQVYLIDGEFVISPWWRPGSAGMHTVLDQVQHTRAPSARREYEVPWSPKSPHLSVDATWVADWIARHRDAAGSNCDMPAGQEAGTPCGRADPRWFAEQGVDWKEPATAKQPGFEGALVGAGNLVSYYLPEEDPDTFPHWTVLYVESREEFQHRESGMVTSQVVEYSLLPVVLVVAFALGMRRRILKARAA